MNKSQPQSQSSFDRHMLPQRNDLASSGGHAAPVRTNGMPLNTWVDPASVRTHQRYDWRTGTMETIHADVLDNARSHMARLKTRTVTSARTHPDRDDMWGCNVGMAAPAPALSGGKSKSKSKRKAK